MYFEQLCQKFEQGKKSEFFNIPKKVIEQNVVVKSQYRENYYRIQLEFFETREVRSWVKRILLLLSSNRDYIRDYYVTAIAFGF